MVSGWVKADANGKATLSIPTNARKDANGNSFTTVTPIALKVKAVSQSGNILSTHTTYEPQVTPAGYHVMNLIPEDSIVSGSTTATTATVAGSKLAGDAQLKVTAAAGQQVTFEFTLPAGQGNWLIQPDLNVPAGKALTFAVNGADLGVSNRNEFNEVSCDPQTLNGDGTTKRQTLETSICTADATAATFTLTPGDGHVHTLTIKAPTGATIHIDQIRLVREPV